MNERSGDEFNGLVQKKRNMTTIGIINIIIVD